MKDQDETREQLEAKLAELRQRIAVLEAAKEALQEERDKAQKYLEIAGVIIVAIDVDQTITVINRKGCEILGYEEEEIVGRNWFDDFIPDRERDETRAVFARLMAGEIEPVEHFENTVLTQSGEERIIAWHNTVLMYEAGNIIGTHSSGTDITERKWTEELARTQRDLALAIGGTFGLETLRLCLETAIRISGMDCGGIYLVDGVSGALDLVLYKDLVPDFISSASYYEADSPNARLVMAGQPIYSEHLQLGVPLDEARRREALHTIAILPVRYEGRVIACLNIASHILDEVPTFARTALEAIAAQIGSAITRVQAEEALRESEEHLQSLFDTMAEGVILIASDGQIVQVNPAAERILRLERSDIQNRNYADLEWEILRPDKTPMSMEERPRFRAMKTRQPLKDVVMGFRHTDGTISWLNVSDAPIMDQTGTITGVVSTFADITERKRAEEALHLYTERLEILREIDQSILTAQSPETIAEVTLGRVRQLIPCQRVDIMLFDSSSNEMLVLAVDAAVETKVQEGAQARFDRFADEIDVLRQDRVVILEEFQPRGKISTAMYAEGVRSFVAVPLTCQDELIGSLNFGLVDYDTLKFEHIDIARHVADSLAVAIQQARLHEQVKRQADELEQRVTDRTRELSVLYKVAALASQSLDLETTLARSLEQVLEAIKSDAGAIHLLDETDGATDDKMLCLAVQQGIPPNLVTRIESQLVSEGLGEWLIERKEPLTLPNITSILQATRALPIEPHAYVGMPLRASGRTWGTLSIVRRTNRPQFNVEELSLLTSVADQLGVVVEGARLRKRAEHAAVFEERERLARELHDSIVQSLYSLTLFAEWGRDLFEDGELKAAKQRLIRIGETAHQALKEMRLLVYELRPALLEQDGLVKALQQRLEAVEKRAGVEVTLQAGSLGRLPAPVEEGLYRIAQEALNNALKHAVASLVTVRVDVENDGEQVTLEVKDDGTGFMPDATSYREGLGLASMRERARRLGSELVVVSTPGEGTRVMVTVEVS